MQFSQQFLKYTDLITFYIGLIQWYINIEKNYYLLIWI